MSSFIVPRSPVTVVMLLLIVVGFWLAYDFVNPSPDLEVCTTSPVGELQCETDYSIENISSYLIWLGTKLGFVLMIWVIANMFLNTRRGL